VGEKNCGDSDMAEKEDRPSDFGCDLGLKSGEIPEAENSYPWE
jgi:hypothetical protein